ncbi:efflux RND transporter periplasmic adaptor subunit [Tranquillimonas rosea]|uniref:efflux RND transporter periplasmic adaptor subunit n=1 Tax=Tranquillimonas rosea TaxID=641238 RepID=UPI003BAB4CDE
MALKKGIGIGLAVVFVAACGAAGVWGTSEIFALVRPSDEQGGGERPPTRVEVAQPQRDKVRDTFQAVGSIRAVRSIELQPLASGRVTEVAVESGERVEEGDLIFALDDRAAQAALQEAEATLSEAGSEFSRVQELATENVSAEAQLEEARAGYRRAQAAVATAEATLDDRRLTAPFSGVLGLVDIDPGERVDTSMSFSSLDDISTVEAQFSVPERYYARAEVGQQVILNGSVYDREFEGEVSVKAPRVDANSRSFTLRVRVPNEDRALTDGMFMTATLVFETYEALTLPDDAIISEGSATYVYTVSDGNAARTPVSLGSRNDGRTEITDGVSADSRVVITGYDRLSDGAPVQVADGEAPQEALN